MWQNLSWLRRLRGRKVKSRSDIHLTVSLIRTTYRVCVSEREHVYVLTIAISAATQQVVEQHCGQSVILCLRDVTDTLSQVSAWVDQKKRDILVGHRALRWSVCGNSRISMSNTCTSSIPDVYAVTVKRASHLCCLSLAHFFYHFWSLSRSRSTRTSRLPHAVFRPKQAAKCCQTLTSVLKMNRFLERPDSRIHL